MKISKISLIFKRAPFPTVMTIISFVLFLAVYSFDALTSVEPHYFKDLVFGIPFIVYGIITLFTVTEKLKVSVSSVITGILIFVLGFAMLIALFTLAFDQATTITTDVGKYERVLRLSNYPNNSLISFFPSKIPSSAKNIVFSYNPAFMQGGENFDLKFQADPNSINNYINEFSKKAKWTGKSSDNLVQDNGVISASFGRFGYAELPEDFTIYLIDSEPYELNNWNHGKISIAAVSKQRNEIIFHAGAW